MQGDGRPAFAPGYQRYKVHQGRAGTADYVIGGPDGRVVASDREPWLRFNWKVLRRRLLQRPGVTIEELDGGEDEGAGAPETPPEVAE
jgi:hypothetical protein